MKTNHIRSKVLKWLDDITYNISENGSQGVLPHELAFVEQQKYMLDKRTETRAKIETLREKVDAIQDKTSTAYITLKKEFYTLVGEFSDWRGDEIDLADSIDFLKSRSLKNWKKIDTFSDITTLELYQRTFDCENIFEGYQGLDLRDCFSSQFDRQWNPDIDPDEIADFYRAMHLKAEYLEEEFEYLVGEKGTYKDGGVRRCYFSRDKKYVFKRSLYVPAFQQYDEFSMWFSTKNPFLLPIEYLFHWKERLILVFPYIEEEVSYKTFGQIAQDITQYGNYWVSNKDGKPLFFDGMELHAWMTSWRKYNGIPLVVDYGEYIMHD